MPESKGYRVDRLRRRRRSKAEHRQAWVLYALAGVVAFAAVLGAWYVGTRWLSKPAQPDMSGYVAIVKLTATPGSAPVAAALAVKDVSGGSYSLYVIPKELLLTGTHGEYVFAGDAFGDGSLKADLQRVIHVRINGEYTMAASKITDLAGGSSLQVALTKPVTLAVAGSDRTYKVKTTVPVSDVATLFAASGPSGEDEAAMQVALWKALLNAAALQPAATRTRLVQSAAGGSPAPGAGPYLSDALRGLTQGQAQVAVVPSRSRVAEGQFAFVPDPDGIMAQITRKSPAYHSRYTVLVRNGCGKVGIGQAVADRLAILDVNLPSVGNAANFNYRRTQIIAGRQALQVAQDIHAILGRGVVLNGGADVSSSTIVVIVGADLKVTDLQPKDQP
jgi:LytR cell envelope-related transcriptional attenuator